MIENIKYIAIGLGLLCLVLGLVDTKYILNKILNRKIDKPSDKNTEPTENVGDFLEIVSLWYQLKSKCDEQKLLSASEKLDEVFPLLNKVIENES